MRRDVLALLAFAGRVVHSQALQRHNMTHQEFRAGALVRPALSVRVPVCPSARLNPVTPDLDCCTFLGFPRRSRSELDRLHSWVVVDRMRLWVRVRAPSGVGRTHKVWDAALVPSSESRTNLDMAAVTPNLDAKAKQVDGHLCQ